MLTHGGGLRSRECRETAGARSNLKPLIDGHRLLTIAAIEPESELDVILAGGI